MASIELTPELPGRRFLTFAVAGRRCAVDLDAVREIVTTRGATRLPGAPAWVSGIVNVRGTLLTVVDLAVRFGRAADGDEARATIVVEVAGKRFGISVDQVRDVQAVAEESLEAVDVQRSAGGVVRALAHFGDARTEGTLVCDVAVIARESLAI